MRMELERLHTSARHPRQAGFSMIEVLITVVIIAIGMLGIAAVQFMSKRSNFEAVQRTAATMLASDIIERMRANPDQLQDYAGDASNPIAPLGGPTATRTLGTDCSTSACDPFALSQYDLWEWETQLNGLSEQTAAGAGSGGLVAPTACIYTSVPAGMVDRSGQYTVAIAWRGGAQMANPTAPTGATAAVQAAYHCGEASGKYNGEDGTPDTHRRVLVVSTYISKN